MTRVLGFASPKVVLPQCEAVAKPRQAVSGTPVRRAPAERRRPGASVLAADKAIRSVPCNVRILPLPATTAPRHGAPWIHGRPRAASADARVVLHAARIGRRLSGACAFRLRGPGLHPRPRYPTHRLPTVWPPQN